MCHVVRPNRCSVLSPGSFGGPVVRTSIANHDHASAGFSLDVVFHRRAQCAKVCEVASAWYDNNGRFGALERVHQGSERRWAELLVLGEDFSQYVSLTLGVVNYLLSQILYHVLRCAGRYTHVAKDWRTHNVSSLSA